MHVVENSVVKKEFLDLSQVQFKFLRGTPHASCSAIFGIFRMSIELPSLRKWYQCILNTMIRKAISKQKTVKFKFFLFFISMSFFKLNEKLLKLNSSKDKKTRLQVCTY